MKIGILTSSRADFGIYYPLVKKLIEDKTFVVEIIAFGTHLKKEYGHTLDEIIRLGFNVEHRVDTSANNEKASQISNSIGDAIIKFSAFWEQNKFDLVFALGDRYEMFAAVSAASPFNIEIAHIHAGETTLGAIDNSYRHCISLMSKYLFVTTEDYRKRAIEITTDAENVFNVGALSIDNLSKLKLLSKVEFKEKFDIDLSQPTILSTFHPETVSFERNEKYIHELIAAYEELNKDYQIIITMPNSDTMGDMIRRKMLEFSKGKQQVKTVESFGIQGYLSCMKHANLMLGNTSSGFVEAAYFPKWVINVGDRQSGRIVTENIINTKITKAEVIKAVKSIEERSIPLGTNIYGTGNAANNITTIIKQLYGIN